MYIPNDQLYFLMSCEIGLFMVSSYVSSYVTNSYGTITHGTTSCATYSHGTLLYR